MKLAFVNLPHSTPVVRRYMCSYNSPIFQFPPLELLYAASAAHDLGQHDVVVIDAIGERLSTESVLSQLRSHAPDMVLTLLGFEIFEQDVTVLKRLRRALPQVRFAAFGHYATVFPHETMRATEVDFVIRGEPELNFVEVCRSLQGNGNLADVPGLTYRADDGTLTDTPNRPWLKHVDELPHPDYSLLNLRRYSEFLMPTPFAVVQTARGCPYGCNFCVRSYGHRLGFRSPANILEELGVLVHRHKIRSFRFIDDTFTAVPGRTLDVCRGIQQNFPRLKWSCLSRVDTLDESRAQALQEAGCQRVYIGIESGSQRILELYGKDYGLDMLPKMVDLLHRHRMEVGAFFMVGHPEETAEDFEQTLALVRAVDLDYAAVGQTVPYPGTPLYDQYREQVEFSLIPYRNEWKDPQRREELKRWERRLYRELYFKVPYIARHAARFLRHPVTTLAAGKALLPFVFSRSEPALVREELV